MSTQTKKGKQFSLSDVAKIAQLANLPISPEKKADLTKSFNAMMVQVEELGAMDTTGIEPTSQVTGLTNVFREDEVDETRMLTQEAAIANTKNSHEGYFVVDAIFEEE